MILWDSMVFVPQSTKPEGETHQSHLKYLFSHAYIMRILRSDLKLLLR